MTDFKFNDKFAELIKDYLNLNDKGKIIPYRQLTGIEKLPGWPSGLETENLLVRNVTEDSISGYACGDWQDEHPFTVYLDNNTLKVSDKKEFENQGKIEVRHKLNTLLESSNLIKEFMETVSLQEQREQDWVKIDTLGDFKRLTKGLSDSTEIRTVIQTGLCDTEFAKVTIEIDEPSSWRDGNITIHTPESW